MSKPQVKKAMRAIQNIDDVSDLLDIKRVWIQRMATFETDYRDLVDTDIFTIAELISHQYEKQHDQLTELWIDLKITINIIDVLARLLPTDNVSDAKLIEILEHLPMPTGDAEKHLAGTWYKIRSIAAGMDWDIERDNPGTILEIADRLRGLHQALQQGDTSLLRSLAQERIKLEPIEIPQIKRPERPPDEDIDWLCNKVYSIYCTNGLTQQEASLKLWEQLDERQLELSGIEIQAHEKLTEWRKKGPGKMHGYLWNAVRRRGLNKQ